MNMRLNKTQKRSLKTLGHLLCGLAIALLATGSAADAPEKQTRAQYAPEIAAIYFPGFHRDIHMDKWLGDGFTEWKRLLDAKPRFLGHRLLRPGWGPFDEADPVWMEKHSACSRRSPS